MTGKKLSESHKQKLRGKRPNIKAHNRRAVINTITGEIYDSIIEAANKINMKSTTLNAQLSGQNKNTTNLKYYVRG